MGEAIKCKIRLSTVSNKWNSLSGLGNFLYFHCPSQRTVIVRYIFLLCSGNFHRVAYYPWVLVQYLLALGLSSREWRKHAQSALISGGMLVARHLGYTISTHLHQKPTTEEFGLPLLARPFRRQASNYKLTKTLL